MKAEQPRRPTPVRIRKLAVREPAVSDRNAILSGMSPTVLRSGPYRLFFFSNEGFESRHIHAQRERMLAKFWLDPVMLASSTGFSPSELRWLQRLAEEKAPELRKARDEYFGEQR